MPDSQNATSRIFDCIVVGAGQSGLATGYYLRRKKVDFLLLDAEAAPGGAWQHAWDSLTLFSDAASSNLPGWPMPHYPGFPPASHVVGFLSRYEERYKLPIRRPVTVRSVEHDGHCFLVRSSAGTFRARTVIAATGTWSSPFVPFYPGTFRGRQWHTVDYPGPQAFAGQSVAVVGAANSGAQIAADLLLNGVETTWYTTHPPRWMPDDVDGRVLFQRTRTQVVAQMRGGSQDATDTAQAEDSAAEDGPQEDSDTNPLGDIVMVPPVLAARDQGLLRHTPMFHRLDEVAADHLIWATGFRPSLRPFRPVLRGRTPRVEGLFLVGYGNWAGLGSATLAGVGPFAKQAAAQAAQLLRAESPR
ncbi:NAD(P)-binding domain-containing protein [Corynebacterium sp.]|uniref:NAD(P)-binding domain-containing protein n=1 Tax=Corynebacterium sp. TaxID=1720 RepID=UPI0026DA7634|nr:NAD(P)-binding domain-containing protein [Corynebacterium sp.]MDO5032621.1 NAD(P)-binding domain-containing protein [Corynebacterium sp.]